MNDRTQTSRGRFAFSIIELLVVMTIIGIIVAIAVPAARSISRNNDENQAANVLRSTLTAARSIAISQHRMAGVVFFEETAQYSRPVNGSQTAMQIFVEDFTQTGYNNIPNANGNTSFVYYSSSRSYLPAGIKVATLSDTPVAAAVALGVNMAENSGTLRRTRAILFDANGNLVLRGGLATPNAAVLPAVSLGNYPLAYGDWGFLPHNVAATPSVDAISAPAFFLYSKIELDAQNFPATAAGDTSRASWLKRHSNIVMVNSNTGTILIEKGSDE